MTVKKMRCISCNSTQVYTLKNGTVVCRHCAFRKEKELGSPKQTPLTDSMHPNKGETL